MAGETTITVIGNLVAKPELRTLASGGVVANFAIASTARQFNRDANQWEDGNRLFLRCNAWDSERIKLASNICASVDKGARVMARGAVYQRSYTANDGTERTSLEMRVEELGVCLSRAVAVPQKAGAARPVHDDTYGYAGGLDAEVPDRDPWLDGR